MTHICLIAPSFPASFEELPFEELRSTQQYLEALGMHVSIPDSLLDKDLLCDHQDRLRLNHLKDVLTDSSFDILWLFRGGYGLTQIIPGLLQIEKPMKEKIFVGFSDGSVLHLFLNQFWGWSSLHGLTARQYWQQTIGDKTRKDTLHLLKEGLSSYDLPALTPLNPQAKQMSVLSGSVVGGNLCLLTCSLGTKWQFNPEGKILFFEDIDERGYRVDRALRHLQQAHIFDGVKAIIFGDFVRSNEADGTSLVEPVVNRFAEMINLPVFRLAGCGHGDENFPLPFNMPLHFTIEEG